MNNNLKNIIILGELDYVLTANFANPKDKARCLAYNSELLPMEQNENGATNINTLYVLNEMLEKIQQAKIDNGGFLQDTCYIAIPKKLFVAIHKGAYKNWLKNDGIAKTGTVFDEREMCEWARFATLYSALFADVTLRDLTYYEMSNPRYDIENMKRHKFLIKAMRENIQKHKDEQMKKIIGLDI